MRNSYTSHWTKIKLKLSDQSIMVKALKRMGLKVEEGSFTITEYGESSEACIKVDKAVGFHREKDGTFSMVGDFYHASSAALKNYYSNQAKFQQDLNTAYGIEDALQKLDDLGMGFEIEENAEAV